eukprot:548641-Rhodomonas_salina.1
MPGVHGLALDQGDGVRRRLLSWNRPMDVPVRSHRARGRARGRSCRSLVVAPGTAGGGGRLRDG